MTKDKKIGVESENLSIDVLRVTDYPCTRLITLNRPAALNALSLGVAQHMLYLHFKRPHPQIPRKALYLLKGAGERSFCAGGDIREIVARGALFPFLKTTYRLNYHILTMPNPQISLWNGYVMGGGVGISIHGRYRVATERAVFAMPETLIGMFPDNGVSHLFPRLPVEGLGLYLGLTGARLKGADLAHVGIATHFVPAKSLGKLEESLCKMDDPSKVDSYLEEFAVKDLPPFTFEKYRKTLQNTFSLKDTTTVESIMDSLASDGSDFAKEAIRILQKASPTCLKVTLELIRRGSQLKTMREAMNMEFLVIQRMARTSEFTVGVKALLIDKTKEPQWAPSTLEDVTSSYVEHFFDSEGLMPWNPEDSS